MSEKVYINNIDIEELESVYLPKAEKIYSNVKPYLLGKVESEEDLSVIKKELVALMICLIKDRYSVVKSFSDELGSASDEKKIALFYETLQDNFDGFFIHPEYCCYFDYPLE
jgi:hypothetical protein